MKQQSVFSYASKMDFPLVLILSLAISVCKVCSQDNDYEYSEQQQPWAFVYTVYPFYNSETLLQVWKTDKAAEVSTNVVTVKPDNDGKSVLSSDRMIQQNDTNLKLQSTVQHFVNEVDNENGEQFPKSRQRLSSFRNRRKDSGLRNE